MTEALDRAGYSVRGLANWLLEYAESVGATHTNMGLNKLLFFAVEAMLVRKYRLLTNAKIEAWEHGPVFREVYQSFKRHGDKPINGRASFYSSALGTMEESHVTLLPEDEALLRSALAPLIHKSASELRAISHLPHGAWHHVWWYDGYANPGMEITPELIINVSDGRHS